MKAKIKAKVKAKAAAVKAKAKGIKSKVKGKCKGKCCSCAAIVAALCAAVLLGGCAEARPASRATTATYDITVKVCMDEAVKSPTVNIPFTFGDGAIASADSAGSTETQTATPTLDIRTKIDARYNDALAAASTASKGVLESLTAAGANKVLELMASKETGTVEVEKKDGTTATVKCENGQCEICTDCEAK